MRFCTHQERGPTGAIVPLWWPYWLSMVVSVVDKTKTSRF